MRSWAWIPQTVAVIGCASACIAAQPASIVAPADRVALLEDVDALIERAMEDWGVPGLAVGVVVDGRPVYARGFGICDTIGREPVTTRTLFPLGGCAEPFTSLVLGMLAEEERVDLDAPLIEHMPTFDMHDTALSDRVTARDLLAQRTGVPDSSLMLFNSPLSRAELTERIRYIPTVSDFRVSFEGSGLNVLVAEHLIEQVTGMSWEGVIQDRVFDQLQMTGSNFGPDGLTMSDEPVRPHRVDADRVRPINLAGANPTGPMGWINSNVEDLMKWLSIYTSGGMHEQERLLQEATLKEMFQPHMFVYWGSFDPYAPTTYGLLWGMNTYQGRYHARLGGFGDGFESLVSVFPHERIGIVLLANRGDETISLLSALKFEIADRLLGIEQRDWVGWAVERVANRRERAAGADAGSVHAPHLAPRDLQEYAGEYENEAFGSVEVACSSGSLRLTINGISMELESAGQDEFRISAACEYSLLRAAQVRFERSNTGECASLVLRPSSEPAAIRYERGPA